LLATSVGDKRKYAAAVASTSLPRQSQGDEKDDSRHSADETFFCTLRSHVMALNARGIRIFVDDDKICS
jgi:hypothetical protein